MIIRAHSKKHSVSWNVRAFALSKMTNISTPVQAHHTHIHHFRHVSLPTLIIPYFLQYKTKRPDYINAFWNILNWNEVNRRFKDIGQ